jgi:hypothetical protein
MKLEKKITFDVVVKEVNIEARLYYPHFRNVEYLEKYYYLPMPYLLFVRRRGYRNKQTLNLVVVEHRINSLKDQLVPFPLYPTLSVMCIDEEHHTLLPDYFTFEQIITKFWNTPFYRSNYILEKWERMSIDQAIMMPSMYQQKISIEDWFSYLGINFVKVQFHET